MGNTDRNQCAWRRAHGAPHGADPCLDTRGPVAGPAQRRRGPDLSPLPGPSWAVGGSPSCPSVLCSLAAQGRARGGEGGNVFFLQLEKITVGPGLTGEGAPALRSLRPASSMSASPAGSDPDTPPAPRTALVTGTESSGTAQHPSLGSPAAPPRGSARLTPPGTKPDGWVFSAPFYRWEH